MVEGNYLTNEGLTKNLDKPLISDDANPAKIQEVVMGEIDDISKFV